MYFTEFYYIRIILYSIYSSSHPQALITWYVYVEERKRKKARITQALQQRRQMLLKRGAAKWLAVAFDLVQMRQSYAAQQGAQVNILFDLDFSPFLKMSHNNFPYANSLYARKR